MPFGRKKGFKHSEETKKKMSLAKIGKPSPSKGRKLTPEQRDRRIKTLTTYWKEQIRIHGRKTPKPKGYPQIKKGDKLPEQWNKNKAKGQLRYYKTHNTPNKGRPHSKETRKKISEGMKSYWLKRKREQRK